MLKILWKREEIAEQFLFLSTIFCYLMLDFYVNTRIRFSPRDKRLFEIFEVEITRVDCTSIRFKCVIDRVHLYNSLVPTMYCKCRSRDASFLIQDKSALVYIDLLRAQSIYLMTKLQVCLTG